MRPRDHSAHSSAHVLAIDGLRALAVLAVIANHMERQILPSGFLGVDIFFVISGFVITRSVQSRTERPLGAFLLDFYSRRVRRLLPALLVTTVSAALLIRLFDPSPKASLLAGLTALFGASNIFLFFMAVDYFGPSAELNVFSHTWSLGVEEQFYLLLPPLMHATLRRRDDSKRRDTLFAWVTGLLTTASLAAFAWTYARNQPAAYFLMPFRIWELGLGCLLAATHWAQPIAGRARVARWLGPASLIASVGILTLPQDDSGATTVAVVIATAVLLSTLQAPSWATRALQTPVAIYIGRISYSLYLWHWVVICLARWTVGIHPWSAPFLLALMFGLTAATYHWVELPCRYGGANLRPTRAVALGGLAAIAGAMLLLASDRYRVPDFSGVRMQPRSRTELGREYVGRSTGRSIDRCTAEEVFADAGHLRDTLDACSTSGGQPHLMMVGDSHAMDLFALAEALHETGTAETVNVFQTGDQVPNPLGATSSRFPADLFARVSEVWPTRPILVVRNNYSPKALDGSLASYSDMLRAWLDGAAEYGFEVVYVAPAPKYPSVGRGGLCTTQWFRPAWALDPRCHDGFEENRHEQEARRRDFTDFLVELAEARPNLHIFDPFDTLCGEAAPGKCAPLRDGRSLYRDSSHLTEYGSESLAEPLTHFLRAEHLLHSPPMATPGS